MDLFLVKILAVGLTLSQLMTRPAAEFKTTFAPEEMSQVHQILHDGCLAVTKEFGAENIDFDLFFSLVTTQIESKKMKRTAEKSITEKMLEKIDVKGLHSAYNRFCKETDVSSTPTDLPMNEMVLYYNKALKDLPSAQPLVNLKLPQASLILDRSGQRFSEVYKDNNRRIWVPMNELPDYVAKAFVAAEDKRFYSHNGIDMRGIIRAFANNMQGGDGDKKKRPQGGSTITQQVIKNLVVGDDLTFERKIREMVVARQAEEIISKDRLLELYINFVFLGRASWGVEMASRSYFGISARQLSLPQAALLAGLTKGPNLYHPTRYPEQAKDRMAYVLNRMKVDGYIDEAQFNSAVAEFPSLIGFVSPRTRGAFYYLDAIQRSARKILGIGSLTDEALVVNSTVHPDLQTLTERALQDGLAQYEADAGRAEFDGAQGTLARDILEYKTDWVEALNKARGKLFDVQWPLAVILESGARSVKGKDGRSYKVPYLLAGLKDGTTLPLKGPSSAFKTLKLYDVVFVDSDTSKDLKSVRLRIPAKVQGSAVIVENKTGRVLAMAGGFSFAASQLNRVTQTIRSPGSTLKPFTYLAALNRGYQPNSTISNAGLRLPPLYKGGKSWGPNNYSRQQGGFVTIRQAIEKSLNLPTARIMAEMGEKPSEGLDLIRQLTQELGIYEKPIRYYPFVLGAQETRVLDMAIAYATIANDGLKPEPHFIDTIERNGEVVYQRPRFALAPIPSADRVSFHQIRRILEGPLRRGTAVRIKDLAGVVGGKTGTSNSERDAWFAGFTNDITVVVWVGYDSRKVESSLGGRFTGGRVALPIAEKILRGSFTAYKPAEPLAPAPEEIRGLIDVQGEDAFRLNNITPMARDNRQPFDLGPYGEEDSPYRAQFYDDREFEQHARLPDRVYQEQQGDSYRPGADDPYDIWRERPRRIDDWFVNSFLFGSQ